MLEFRREKIDQLDCVIGRKQDVSSSPRLVVIMCHGFGASGTDLVGLAPELAQSSASAMDDVEYIFPAAPIELDPMFESRAWWMLDMEKIQQLMAKGEFRELGTSKPPELPDRRSEIIGLIEAVKAKHSMEESSIVLGGFSQGSMLALDVALHHDTVLGGLILWSSALINQEVWTEMAEKQEQLSIFQSHGTIDPILPFAGAELLRDTLGEKGHQVNFLRFQGGHTIPPEGIKEASTMINNLLS